MRIANLLAGLAVFASCAALVAVSLALAQSASTRGLEWHERFLGIIPLVKPDPKDPVVATVNGSTITLAEVDSYAKTEARMINATSTAETRATWQDAVENLVNRTLLIQEAQRKGVKVPEMEVAQRARMFELANANGQAITQTGVPDPLLLKEVEQSMAIEKMLDEVFKSEKVVPTQKVIETYYNQHKDLFVSDPGDVRISHIAVRIPPNATEQQRQAAVERISRLYDEAKTTKDFAELARKNSDDSVSAPKGGDLGYFRPGQLPPVVEKQAFSTPTGQLSQIIASNIGYSFMKITDHRGATFLPLKDVKSKIALVILDYNQDDAVKALLRRLHHQARIEYTKAPGPAPASGT
jgi:parvulin-like peptidyl-prolyl isomerase